MLTTAHREKIMLRNRQKRLGPGPILCYDTSCGNRVLRRIFGPKRDEAKGEWRRLHNEELNDMYSSPNIIWVIKSKRMGWAGHVARMGTREVHTGFWWGDLREGNYLGDPGAEGRIILKWISKKWDGAWTGLSWLKIGTGGGLL
jgi:hypothetical protein